MLTLYRSDLAGPCADELRLAKYAGRGFSVAVPGLQMHHVQHRHATDGSLVDLHGLSRRMRTTISNLD